MKGTPGTALRLVVGYVEGNALFPGGNGGTDRYAQASILDLYDPDRARHFKKDGKVVSREEALSFLDELSKKFAANQGEGLAFLAESSTSPSRARLQKIIAHRNEYNRFVCRSALRAAADWAGSWIN